MYKNYGKSFWDNLIYFTILIYIIITSVVYSQQITIDKAANAGNVFFNAQKAVHNSLFSRVSVNRTGNLSLLNTSIFPIIDRERSDTVAFCVNLDPEGYIIISGDQRITPVIAYSYYGKFDTSNSPYNLHYFLIRDIRLRKQALKDNVTPSYILQNSINEWSKLLSNSYSINNIQAWPNEISGFTETNWGQGQPYENANGEILSGSAENDMCPDDPVTDITPGAMHKSNTDDGRCLTGCVATAMGQIVNYWGTNTGFPKSVDFSTDEKYQSKLDPGDGNGERQMTIDPVSANFINMSYPAVNVNMAELLFACGVSVKMQYSDAGSGANTEVVADALKSKFGYHSAIVCNLDIYSKLQENIKNGMPCQLSISMSANSKSGHSIVADGYKNEGGADKYHLNFGWNGDASAWYSLPDGMPADYNIVNYAVVDIVPGQGIQKILPSELIQGTKGKIEIEVAAPKDGTYYLKVAGLPSWSILSRTSDYVILTAGSNHVFSFDVTPSSSSNVIQFELYKESAFPGVYARIDKIEKFFSALDPDNILPNVSIIYPSDGALVKDTVIISVTAGDTGYGVDHVELYINDSLLGKRSTPPFEFTWDTKLFPDGTVSLKALAFDVAGNSSYQTITVNVENNILIADFDVDVKTGKSPLTVAFIDKSTGNIISWKWDFNNDGTIDSEERYPKYTYTTSGFYSVSLTVSDGIKKHTLTQYKLINVTEDICNIIYAECFIDFDPGPDKRIKIPVNLLSDVSCTQTLDIKYLEDGIHTLFVRVKDDQDKWSQIFSKVFIKVPSENSQLRNIVKLRYSIDAPIDEMHALYADVTPGRDIQSIFNAALTGLPEGIHKIHVQALDEKGINSLIFSKEFIKQHISTDAAANIVQMEYFTDNDPGQGMAEKVNFIPADSISMNVILPLTGLSNGIHTIHVRCKNGSGVWSLLFSRVFIKSSLSGSLSTEISKIGYFISADDYLSEIKYCNNIIKSQNGEFSFTADLTGLMTDSVYNLHIFVMDNSGLSSQMYSKEFLIKVTSQSYKILVEKGWNLISVPESSHDQKITDLFTNAVSDAWYFTGSYALGDMTEQGKGFWIKYAKGDTISFVSDRKADSIKVKAGWNIVGGLTENVSQYSLRTIPDNIFTSSFYSFRNNTGYLTEDSLVTGKGYWIRASREGTIFLNPNSSQKYSPAGIAAKDPDWKGRITVTDKNGNCKTLYITASNQSLSSFDLPPVPPEGIFDVRWSTDRSAESAGAKCMVISSAEYPLTIKLEGISASIKDISGGRTINKLLKAGESLTISNPSAERLQVEEAEIPLTFELYQNYPNPFNPSTKITYTLAKDSHVTLKIYNALGELVQQLSDEIRPSGPNEITFNAIHLSSGIYFYELNAHSTDGSKTFKNVKKFLLLK